MAGEEKGLHEAVVFSLASLPTTPAHRESGNGAVMTATAPASPMSSAEGLLLHLHAAKVCTGAVCMPYVCVREGGSMCMSI